MKYSVLVFMSVLLFSFTKKHSVVKSSPLTSTSKEDSIFKAEYNNIVLKLSNQVNTQVKNNDSNKFIFSQFSRLIPLEQNIFDSLKLKEKIIYALDFPEDFHYTCSSVIPISSTINFTPYLYSDFNQVNFGNVLSLRQGDFLKTNKTDAIAYLKKYFSISDTFEMSDNYKKVIVEKLNAISLIPEIIKTTHKSDDLYLFTALTLLMKNNKFPEFLKSNIYKQLYLKNRQQINTIELTPKIRTNILKMAEKFYAQKMGK